MMSQLERSEAFRRDIKASTDPAWLRQQLGRPHQYSRTFTVCMLLIGTAAAFGILFAAASI